MLSLIYILVVWVLFPEQFYKNPVEYLLNSNILLQTDFFLLFWMMKSPSESILFTGKLVFKIFIQASWFTNCYRRVSLVKYSSTTLFSQVFPFLHHCASFSPQTSPPPVVSFRLKASSQFSAALGHVLFPYKDSLYLTYEITLCLSIPFWLT